MLLASEIFNSCWQELTDPEHVRWPESELADYLTGAIAQLASLKPSLFNAFVDIQLGPGPNQSVPVQYTELIDILYNINPDGTVGQTITQASFTAARALGRPSCAIFYDGTYVVQSFTVHPNDDTFFDVDPPVPANRRPTVRALVRLAPNVIVSGTDAVIMANTTPETYREALKDWVLYRAFAKDQESSDSFQRSQAHYKAFMQFVGVPPRDKDGVPVSTSPRETAGVPST